MKKERGIMRYPEEETFEKNFEKFFFDLQFIVMVSVDVNLVLKTKTWIQKLRPSDTSLIYLPYKTRLRTYVSISCSSIFRIRL